VMPADVVLPQPAQFEGGRPLKTFDLGGENFSGTRSEWTTDGRALVYPVDREGSAVLVEQPLDFGRMEDILKLDDELFDFRYSPDGKMLAVTRGGWQHDVVLISDFNRAK